MTIVYPMKIKDEIIFLIELKSKEERTNKAIVLKQFLYRGLEDYAINLVSRGRLSIGKAAEILDLSIYDMHEIAKSKGIKLGPTKEQWERSKKYLFKKNEK